METILVILSAIIIVLLIVILLKKNGDNGKTEIIEQNRSDIKLLGEMLRESAAETAKLQAERFSDADKHITEKQDTMSKNLTESLHKMEERIYLSEKDTAKVLSDMREIIEKRLDAIRTDNNAQLDKMQKTVDEKLEKTLEAKMEQSFKLVSERLEQVYKGLGEMQNVAQGVGDLKKVLSNVKTRGILGEIQLGAILKEILSPEQYCENIATIPGSSSFVEFAIKMPNSDGEFVYLPIDSKFPLDAYSNLRDAYDEGDADKLHAARSVMITRMKSFAKDIHDKYIEVPYTTEFAIMFLPFEGLYAEAVNCGMVETLQREYKINIAGPSTMAALLNSLQMGFKTVAIQKRSMEVWTVLGQVKSEFSNFAKVLESTQKRLSQAGEDLDKLVGTRTRAIERKLRNVEKLEPESSNEFDEADE